MGKKFTIGVLIGNVHTAHPKDLMRGIRAAASGMDVNMIYFLGTQSVRFNQKFALEDFDYQYNTVYDYAKLAKVDVLIIAYGSLCIFQENEDKQAFLDKFAGIPYVLLEDATDDPRGIYVMVDNYGGMQKCVEHLIIEHHLKHLVYLGGPEDNQDAIERKAAFLNVMAEHHLPVTPEMMAVGDYSEFVDNLVEQLLRDNPDAEAIISANDEMTVACYRVCKAHGLRIGKDILITGFDDVERARYSNPPLTTVSQDAYKMGQIAVEKAVDICAGRPVESVRLDAELIIRESCGCKVTRRAKEKADEKTELLHIIDELRLFQHKSWLGPFLIRDLMQEAENEKSFYRKSGEVFYHLGIRSSLLYLLEQPVTYEKGQKWKMPQRMYLTMHQYRENIQVFEKKERPYIDGSFGVSDCCSSGEDHFSYISFLLIDGKRQYGLLMLEIEPEEISFYYILALQLGTSLRFLEANIKQKKYRDRLREKNEVLNFIAIYDELTGIYNRRGLMESLVRFNQDNLGKKACLMIADLDHLKEINDNFGHAEGDCAIRTAAGIVKEVFGQHGDVGRFGGDEFAGIVRYSEMEEKEQLIYNIHQKCEQYNEHSMKPYYVGISVGVVEFVCEKKIDFIEMFKHADEYLYEEKKKRRKTVCRNVNFENS